MEQSISTVTTRSELGYLAASLLRFSYFALSSEDQLLHTLPIQILQKLGGMPANGKVLLTLSMKSMEDSTSGTPTS